MANFCMKGESLMKSFAKSSKIETKVWKTKRQSLHDLLFYELLTTDSIRRLKNKNRHDQTESWTGTKWNVPDTLWQIYSELKLPQNLYTRNIKWWLIILAPTGMGFVSDHGFTSSLEQALFLNKNCATHYSFVATLTGRCGCYWLLKSKKCLQLCMLLVEREKGLPNLFTCASTFQKQTLL